MITSKWQQNFCCFESSLNVDIRSNNFIELGLRDCPAEMYPEVPREGEGVPVTLQTTKAQEVHNYIQPTYRVPRLLIPKHLEGREFHPGDVADAKGSQFMRAEMATPYRRLEELQPSTLFIFGRMSDVSSEEARRAKMERTGKGVGGNGGIETGMVKEVILDCRRLVPLEEPLKTANAYAKFLDAEVKRWVVEEGGRRRIWEGLSRREQVEINDLWRKKVGKPPKRGSKDKSETKL